LQLDADPRRVSLVASALAGALPAPIPADSRTTIEAGLEQIRTGIVDLVMVSPELAENGGLEALRSVSPDARRIPVVILADAADDGAAIEAVRRGAEDYLVASSINPVMLARVVRYSVERARHEAELSASTERLRSLLASVQSPVLALDDSMTVLYCNDAYAHFTGRAVTDIEGESLTVLFPEVVETASYGAYRASLETGRAQEVEGPFRDRYLRTRVFRAPFGLVAVAEDITSHKKAEEALRERTRELEAKNEELDAFSHTVAHDLRNPLGVIRGFAEQLIDHRDAMEPGEIRQCLDAVLGASVKMNTIIDELLLLAGVRKGREVAAVPLDMGLIVSEAMLRLSHITAELDAEIVVRGTLPTALGHGPWVEEVWVNYLSNALLHGGRPPRIVIEGAGESDFVRFSVQDNGNGISPEEEAALFAPFTRLHDGRTPGHGLGLSIVRRIVERLNGRVGVASTPGEGSAFWFTLPRSS
jgi:PAS domain S-box-containing protein